VTAREVLLKAAELYEAQEEPRSVLRAIYDASATRDDGIDARMVLRAHIDSDSIIDWELKPGRTAAEVIAALRGAAEGATP
jgi:hypothetical protein